MATRSKRLRGASDASGGDLELRVDPSLMTERQQLAFLLRQTAPPDARDSAASSSSSSDDSDGDDPRHVPPTKKPKRVAPKTSGSKSPPPASREDLIAAALKNPAGLVLYCGRGRPPKNAIKLAPGEEMPADLKKLVETAAHHVRRRDAASDAVKDLRVTTDASDRDEHANPNGDKPETAKRKAHETGRDKTSPSSASELSQHLREAYEDHHGDFALASPCALCCRVSSPFDAPLEALFLCPTCDRKYPTQRALGLA